MEDRQRLDDLRRLYALLDKLKGVQGGMRRLVDCNGRMDWPQRGLYWFFEPGEDRRDSGSGPRVVRVGTHALKHGSRTTLWQRLSQHQGVIKTGGGNHRGSIFRLLVGTAIAAQDGESMATWGQGSTAPRATRESELLLEQRVSDHIRQMPFLYLEIPDAAGPDSLRGYIERNAIALLSNYDREPLDPPSNDWLGWYCNRERVRRSGLWNQNHVDASYDPAFLDVLEAHLP